MPIKILDGKEVAKSVRDRIRQKIDEYLRQEKRAPHLAVFLVGDNPASQVYVEHKEKACSAVGIKSTTVKLPHDTSQAELLEQIEAINRNPDIDGILPQLPLPDHIDRVKVVHRITPSKDIDGLGSFNQGRLQWDLLGHRPCTPLGVMEIFKFYGIDVRGKLVAVLGRSLLVGAPMCALLGNAGATVISMHADSKNTVELTKLADIVIVATGVHQLVNKDWIKPGAVVVDVGIHRMLGKISGDVDFLGVKEVAGAITPVPGGVGPMTIAMLLSNTFNAYEFHIRLEEEARNNGGIPKRRGTWVLPLEETT